MGGVVKNEAEKRCGRCWMEGWGLWAWSQGHWFWSRRQMASGLYCKEVTHNTDRGGRADGGGGGGLRGGTG